MAQVTKNWIAHEPSTYSYLGRNDGCVSWMLTHREPHGFPLPKTLVLTGSGARLKATLVHVVNQDDKYSSSYYYSTLGKDNLPLVDQQTVQQNIDAVSQKFNLPITKQVVTIEQLAKLAALHVYFGFVVNEDGKDGTVWYSPLSFKDAFGKLTSSTDMAFTEQIIFLNKYD